MDFSSTAVQHARELLDATSLADKPYGVYVDGQIVSVGTQESCKKVVKWWRQTFASRKVSVRKRKATDLVLGEKPANSTLDDLLNVLAISGGRVGVRETGVTLPVGNGYSVTIDLAGNDTYTVRRVFKRGAKVWIKGEQTDVYCEEVGEIAYQASSFRGYEFPKGGE